MDWDLGNKSNKICMTNKNNFHCSVKDVCLLLQGARGSWLLEGENWKVTIKSWFKCHLAFDTGSRSKNVGARSWEQIWDLTKVSKGLEEHKNTTSARLRRWSPLHLTRGKGKLEQVSNKAPTLPSNKMHEDETEWMHSFFLLSRETVASLAHGALPGLCQWPHKPLERQEKIRALCFLLLMRDHRGVKMLRNVDSKMHESATEGLSLILYFCFAKERRI